MYTAADQVVANVKVEVVDDIEIEQAVVVVIEEGRSHAPAAVPGPRLLRDRGESAVPLVEVQRVRSVVGHVQVRVAVVVVVPDGTAHAVPRVPHSRLCSHVGKTVVRAVPEEAVADERPGVLANPVNETVGFPVQAKGQVPFSGGDIR